MVKHTCARQPADSSRARAPKRASNRAAKVGKRMASLREILSLPTPHTGSWEEHQEIPTVPLPDRLSSNEVRGRDEHAEVVVLGRPNLHLSHPGRKDALPSAQGTLPGDRMTPTDSPSIERSSSAAHATWTAIRQRWLH